MNIRGNIINNLLETENSSKVEDFNGEINRLIEDEQEAIDGYNDSLVIFEELFPEKYAKISDTIFHIINEEKEHIKELNGLRNIILGGRLHNEISRGKII